MEADIEGPQRKVKVSAVRPVKGPETGVVHVRDGRTMPFVVSRGWIAPAGHYQEQWFLIHPESREVFYESPSRDVLVWGLQALTELEDVVREEIPLAAGTYQIVFALGGLQGGALDVQVTDAPATEAA